MTAARQVQLHTVVVGDMGGVEGGGGSGVGEAGVVAGGLAGEVGVAGEYVPSSCGRLQSWCGEAVAGDRSALLFFVALVCIGEETCCCCGGDDDTSVATTAA